MSPEREPEILSKLRKHPMYSQWSKWIDERLFAFGLQIVNTYSPTEKIIISRIVNSKDYYQNKESFGFRTVEGGTLIKISIKETEREAQWQIMKSTFEKANLAQQAASMACTMPLVSVTASSLFGDQNEVNREFLTQMEDKYYAMFTTWSNLDKGPTPSSS